MAIIGVSVHVKAPVRAVKYHNEELYYGQGDQLHFKGTEIIKIPGSERIISLISSGKGKDGGSLFIITEFNLYKLANLNGQEMAVPIPMQRRDRILTILDEKTRLWVVQASGNVILYLTSNDYSYNYCETFSFVNSSSIFYSASIVKNNVNNTIEIAFGTIFSGIQICRIDTDINTKNESIKYLYSLEGHKGTVFDVKHHPDDQDFLISCSDDRTVRIWKREGSNFSQFAICNGHAARVWAIDVFNDYIASISEDNTCRIWNINKTANMIKCIEHETNSKSIWSVSASKRADKIAIGSNDGSVIVHSIKSNITRIHSEYDIKHHFGSGLTNFIVTPKGETYFTTETDHLVCLSSKESSLINGLKKSPAMALNKENLFVSDEGGNLYYKSFNESGLILHKYDFKFPAKITRIFAFECILIETSKGDLFIINQLLSSFELVPIDKKYKVTCALKHHNEYFLGTRQGVLVVLNSRLEVVRQVSISKKESLKSIKIKGDFICILDRAGMEFVFDQDFNNFERVIIGRGGVTESYSGDQLISSFHQQHFVLNSPEFGVFERIFCGGGHRLWSSSHENDQFAFSFISDGKLNLYSGKIVLPEVVSKRSHGKEIRCSHTSKNNTVFSGSEDGLIKLFKEEESLDSISETRLSNTSVKCITSSGSLIFIGGSNETIEVFEIDKYSRFIHKASCPKQIENIETRVLCMDTKLHSNGCIMLLVGYSDASIRIFSFNIIGTLCSFNLLHAIENVHYNRCVQQIKWIGTDFKFISTGPDGFIKGWEQKGNTYDCIWSIKIHESGINCLDIFEFGDEEEIKVLTGGEDGNVVLTKIKGQKLEKITTKQSHNSTVTCVKFHANANLLISTSIDRFIVISDASNEKEIEIKRTTISDISAMTISSKHLKVFGSGIESFLI